MHINDLTDDCLLRIFRLFRITERVRNERVCTRWCGLLPRVFNDTQELDAADVMIRTYKTHYLTDSIHLTPTLVGILRRCGTFLREISFGNRWLKVSQQVIDTMAERCSKLTTLNLSCVILHADIRAALQQLGPQLVAFSLDETHWVREDDAAGVEDSFSTMDNLKELSLKRASFSLRTLHELPIDLEMINLCGARRLELEVLRIFLFDHIALRRLHLGNNEKIDQSVLEIIGSLPSIRVLELSYINRDDVDLSPIAQLHATLEELYLQSNNSLVDNAFDRICTQCSELAILNVCNCKRLRDFGVLSCCRKMKTLLASNTPQICDTDLVNVATNGTLESLTLTQCVNIGSPGLTAIAQKCPLREICIAQCSSVDDSALLALAENHRPIPMISLQNCHLTNDGVAALGQLDGEKLSRLCELDISYNKSINSSPIMAVYHAIANSDFGQIENHHQITNREKLISDVAPRLTIHVHQTSISKDLEPLVADFIRLIF